MDPKQSTDKDNKEKVAGTYTTNLTPRDSTGTVPVPYGASGENATPGNRNAKS